MTSNNGLPAGRQLPLSPSPVMENFLAKYWLQHDAQSSVKNWLTLLYGTVLPPPPPQFCPFQPNCS